MFCKSKARVRETRNPKPETRRNAAAERPDNKTGEMTTPASGLGGISFSQFRIVLLSCRRGVYVAARNRSPYWSRTMTFTAPYEVQEIDSFDTQAIPAEAAMVMSALDAGDVPYEEKRVIRRVSYRTITRLRLFRDQPDSPGWEVFTRDVNRRGLGFLSRHRLPLGYGGVVQLPDENGASASVHCTLSRCREAAPGWYEGCICFNREQPQFDL
jgi:hypothetical protein